MKRKSVKKSISKILKPKNPRLTNSTKSNSRSWLKGKFKKPYRQLEIHIETLDEAIKQQRQRIVQLEDVIKHLEEDKKYLLQFIPHYSALCRHLRQDGQRDIP